MTGVRDLEGDLAIHDPLRNIFILMLIDEQGLTGMIYINFVAR
jgi:hypothetical protein